MRLLYVTVTKTPSISQSQFYGGRQLVSGRHLPASSNYRLVSSVAVVSDNYY